MRIVAVSMVKNESDIVESFVRYHAPIVDAHYLLDNCSSDSTGAILQRLRAEGLPIIVAQDADGLYDQSRKMTDLMRRAARETDADFVLPLDADEFVLDRRELEARLRNLGASVGMLRWFDYIATSDDDKTQIDVLRRITHRIEPSPLRYKVCVPRSVALRQTAHLGWGQHQVNDDTAPVVYARIAEPLLAHIPIRSGPQLVSKAVIGRLALRASRDWKPGLGFHWDRIAQSIKQPSSVSEQELQRATLILSDPPPERIIVRHPLKVPYAALKYTDLILVDPLEQLLAFASRLLDDEMYMEEEIDGQPDSGRNFIMARNWRRRWQQTEAECEFLKHSRKHAARVLVDSAWRTFANRLPRWPEGIRRWRARREVH